MTANGPILELRGIKTHFPVREGLIFDHHAGTVKAVDGVSLQVQPGEILGLVGESGCGKSTLARTVLGLAPITSGTIHFEGRDITRLRRNELRSIRPRLQMIFQDPYASLNPRMTVSDTLAEPLKVHRIVPPDESAKRVNELMEKVGLARRYARKYPHEFSGGQRQRIAIARALAMNPKVILADEPVSALDVSIQAQILNLLADLRKQEGLTLLLISHDLAVVNHASDRIAVMYLGKIVEIGAAESVYRMPLHPYSKALLSAIPLPDPEKERSRKRIFLKGDPPSPLNPPSGCSFHPRCPYAEDVCYGESPHLETMDGQRQVACHFAREIASGKKAPDAAALSVSSA
ncbi:MAG: ABC transporter ATP-binding protein [Candidatus Hydrogenedentota bacterium]